jgi:hypothetical protein
MQTGCTRAYKIIASGLKRRIMRRALIRATMRMKITNIPLVLHRIAGSPSRGPQHVVRYGPQNCRFQSGFALHRSTGSPSRGPQNVVRYGPQNCRSLTMRMKMKTMFRFMMN